MEAPRIRIGNQPSCHVPSRRPYEFAWRHGFVAFEWFSDGGSSGWCEADMDSDERTGLREVAAEHGVLFSVHAPLAFGVTVIRFAAAVAFEAEDTMVQVLPL